jgi:hypothetical protein
MRRRTHAVGIALALLAATACTRDADSRDHVTRERNTPGDSDARSAVPSDSVASIAREVFEAFLDASREGSNAAVAVDTLTRCTGDNGTYFPTMMLAEYTVQQLESRGDTVVARASVVTVAEQDIDRRVGGFVARQRIRTDVLEWDVYENEWGQWVVCNGLRFGYKGADSLTVWRPEGSSYRTARAMADSIAAARR